MASSSHVIRSGMGVNANTVSGEASVASVSVEGITDMTDISQCKEESRNSTPSTLKRTVIRLKRRIEDSPSMILKVSYKRSKTDINDVPVNNTCNDSSPTASTSDRDDESSSNPIRSKILRLVGTIPDHAEESVALAVKNIFGCDNDKPKTGTSSETNLASRRSIKAKTSKIAEKSRERFKKNLDENRFKMVSSKRGVSEMQETDEYQKNLLKLLDLVPESDVKESRIRLKPEGFEPGNVTCNGKPMVKEISTDESGFVYDLYISSDPCIEELVCDQYLSIEEGDELDFGEYRVNNEQDDDVLEDNDDSNDEGNWRNDYPDSDDKGTPEESNSSDSDEEMVRGIRNMHMARGFSSSDDEVVYGLEDDHEERFMSFGNKYAQYKRRVLREYEEEVVSSESDDD